MLSPICAWVPTNTMPLYALLLFLCMEQDLCLTCSSGILSAMTIYYIPGLCSALMPVAQAALAWALGQDTAAVQVHLGVLSVARKVPGLTDTALARLAVRSHPCGWCMVYIVFPPTWLTTGPSSPQGSTICAQHGQDCLPELGLKFFSLPLSASASSSLPLFPNNVLISHSGQSALL